MVAAFHLRSAALADLLRCGADAEARCCDGRTALHHAALRLVRTCDDAGAVVRELLRGGARADARDAHGVTAAEFVEAHDGALGSVFAEWVQGA